MISITRVKPRNEPIYPQHIPVDEAFLTEVSELQKERVFHVTHDRIHYNNDRVWLEQTLEALRYVYGVFNFQTLQLSPI